MQVFRRGDYNQVWFTLRSDEVLGVLDSSYIQDYFGNQGQVTLLNLQTQERLSIPITEVTGPSDPTPLIPHDVFSGYVDLDILQDGSYKIEGLVRDVIGNYTILSEIQNPVGGERVISFDLRITDDEIIVLFEQSTISLGLSLTIPLTINKQISTEINKVSVFPLPIVEYLTAESLILKGRSVETKIEENLELSATMIKFDG